MALSPDDIRRKLMQGGFGKVKADTLPCDLWVRKEALSKNSTESREMKDMQGQTRDSMRGHFQDETIQKSNRISGEDFLLRAVLLAANSTSFRGREEAFWQLTDRIKKALASQYLCECEALCIVFSSDPSKDRGLAMGNVPVWIIDEYGRRIVFENQPGTFGGLEKLLEESGPAAANKTDRIRIEKINWKNLPWATLSLAAVNIFLWMIMAVQFRITGGSFFREGGYSRLQNFMELPIFLFYAGRPHYYRLLTAAFTDGSTFSTICWCSCSWGGSQKELTEKYIICYPT